MRDLDAYTEIFLAGRFVVGGVPASKRDASGPGRKSRHRLAPRNDADQEFISECANLRAVLKKPYFREKSMKNVTGLYANLPLNKISSLPKI